MNVFKISLPGNDVKEARLTQEVIDSKYASPKVDTLASPPHAGIISVNWQSSIAVPLATTKLLYSFPHNYGYIPTAFASYSFDNGTRVVRGTLPFQIGSLGIVLIDTDDTNVNLKYFSIDLSSTAVIPNFLMKVRFYVMAERGKG